MRDGAFARRNLTRSLARSRGFVVFVTIGLAVAMALITVVGHSKTFGEENPLHDSALRGIEVSSVSGNGPVRSLTGDDIAAIESMSHVVGVTPMPSEAISFVEGSGSLWVTSKLEFGQAPIIDSVRSNLYPLAPDEIVLPDSAEGIDYRPRLGKTLTMLYTVATGSSQGTGETMPVTVVGIYDSGYGSLDGPNAAYAHVDLATMLAAAKAGMPLEQMESEIGYEKAMVEVENVDAVLDVQRLLTEEGFSATSVRAKMDTIPNIFGMLRWLAWGVVAILGLYCLGSGLSIGAGLVRQRWRDIGLLKAIGFTRKRVAKVFAIELAGFGAVTGILGVMLGIAAGMIVGMVYSGELLLGAQMRDGVPVPPLEAVVVLLLLPIVALLLGGALSVRRAATLPPDAALRELTG